jgi:hypothetical protein
VLPVLAQNPITTTYVNAQKQASAPASPPAGYDRLWVGTDNLLKLKQPDGTIQFMPYYLSSLDGIVLATSGVLSQFAPAPGGGDAAKFLRGDGTWADAAGGGGFELQTETSFTNNSTPAIYLKAPSPSTTPFLQFLDNSNASKFKVFYNGAVESAGDFYSGTGIFATTGTSITLRTAGNTNVGIFREYGSLSFEGANPSTSGVPKAWLDFTGTQNNTGITSSTEYNAFWYNPPRTYTWAAGAITNQRFFYMRAPTIAFSGTSTVTTAATLAISGAPVAGTNATITNPYALWVGSGTSQFDGNVSLGSSNVLLLGGATSPGTATRLQLGTPTTSNNNVNVYLEPTATTVTAIAIQGNASQTADLFQVFNSSGTKVFYVNAKGVAHGSPSGIGINATAFGHQALDVSGGGINATAFGYSAGYNLNSSGTDDTLIGSNAGYGLTTGAHNVAVGSTALQNDQTISSSVIIGSGALNQSNGGYTGTGPVLAIGRSAGSDLTNQNNIAVFGSATSPLNDWYFGESYSTASPSDITFQPSVASGTNIAGSSFYLKGGAGTGNATPGKLYLQYASAGSSGATVQSYTTAVTIDSAATDVAGLLQVDRIAGTTSAPSISAGAAAGTSPTVSVTGTDLGGEIVVTTGTGSVGSGTLATITLNVAFANDCYPVLQAADADARGVAVNITHSSTGFTIVAGAAGWSTSTEYKWTYIVAGR